MPQRKRRTGEHIDIFYHKIKIFEIKKNAQIYRNGQKQQLPGRPFR